MISTFLILGNLDSSSFNVIISKFTSNCTQEDDLLKEFLRILKPKGLLVIQESINNDKTSNSTIAKLKLNGFLVKSEQAKILLLEDGQKRSELIAEKPSYEVENN